MEENDDENHISTNSYNEINYDQPTSSSLLSSTSSSSSSSSWWWYRIWSKRKVQRGALLYHNDDEDDEEEEEYSNGDKSNNNSHSRPPRLSRRSSSMFSSSSTLSSYSTDPVIEHSLQEEQQHPWTTTTTTTTTTTMRRYRWEIIIGVVVFILCAILQSSQCWMWIVSLVAGTTYSYTLPSSSPTSVSDIDLDLSSLLSSSSSSFSQSSSFDNHWEEVLEESNHQSPKISNNETTITSSTTTTSWDKIQSSPSSSSSSSSRIPSSSLYLPGAGFSGFWYTLGALHRRLNHPMYKQDQSQHLQNQQHHQNQHYYCYSAGCLGTVVILSRPPTYSSMEYILHLATSSQELWRNGTISQYDIVSYFVDGLLHGLHTTNDDDTDDDSIQEWLSRIHIITAVRSKGTHHHHHHHYSPSSPSPRTRTSRFGNYFRDYILESHIRTPTTISELRTMLIQTTWIPLVTGNGFMYQNHMDGGFSVNTDPIFQEEEEQNDDNDDDSHQKTPGRPPQDVASSWGTYATTATTADARDTVIKDYHHNHHRHPTFACCSMHLPLPNHSWDFYRHLLNVNMKEPKAREWYHSGLRMGNIIETKVVGK